MNARSPDTDKNANKPGGNVELLCAFSTCRENIPDDRKASLRHKLLLLLPSSAWCPLAGNLSSIVADTNRNANR
ncbi:hypothetical protein ACVW1C_003015 [Bradyrhizobium sp. USDA 4011]